nr:hypothetical protein [Tanacetum cinerariifolium]
MSSRKHNLRNKSTLLSDIPILDFDVSKYDDIEIDWANSFVGVSKEYLDHGDPTHICDAMTLCKWFGYPDFFITFTCNPKWLDISRFVRKRGLKPKDRPEVLCRMFKFKLDHLIKTLKDNQIFGRVRAVVYTIEFQKRGLPHSHICLFLHKDDKLLNSERINDFISAEIPDKDFDLDLYTLVTEHMMHGPCGADILSCPCIIKGVCTKKFPKKYSNHTTNDSTGYLVYRRKKDGKFVEKNRVRLDNGFVVPYNSYLLKKYQAHINVEWCNQADVNDAMGSKKKNVVVTFDPLTLIAEKINVSRSKEKVVVSLDFEGSGSYDFSELKKITALLAKAFNRRKFYSKPTNNNLRTSSSSQSANKKQEFVKTDNKRERHFSKDCKKAKVKDYEYYKTKMLLEKNDKDEQVLLAEDQAWMESSSDSDQVINANMVFMAQIKKVLSDSEASSSSADTYQNLKVINANMVFMAQIKKVLYDSEASSSSADTYQNLKVNLNLKL